STIRVFAMDNYGAEIPVAEIEKYQVLLALKANGRWLGLGDRGPAWVVYPRDQHPELQAQDDAKWVWSAIRIDVEGRRRTRRRSPNVCRGRRVPAAPA